MGQQPKRNTLEQGRAEFAYECAKRASDNASIKADYKSYVKKTPMLIKMNGLGATIAFIKSKEKKNDAYKTIYQNISDWLVKQKIIGGNDELIKVIIQKDSTEYRQITIEVLAFLNWLKRFVDGLIQKEGTDGDAKG